MPFLSWRYVWCTAPCGGCWPQKAHSCRCHRSLPRPFLRGGAAAPDQAVPTTVFEPVIVFADDTQRVEVADPKGVDLVLRAKLDGVVEKCLLGITWPEVPTLLADVL